jgi:predicted RNase H-like HicB family nuclease
MNPFRYRVVITWSDRQQCYVARVPAIAGCQATGDTVAQAAREVVSAAEAVLEVMKEDGEKPPAEDV